MIYKYTFYTDFYLLLSDHHVWEELFINIPRPLIFQYIKVRYLCLLELKEIVITKFTIAISILVL